MGITALDSDGEPAVTLDTFDDTNSLASLLEYGTLLNVQFEVGSERVTLTGNVGAGHGPEHLMSFKLRLDGHCRVENIFHIPGIFDGDISGPDT